MTVNWQPRRSTQDEFVIAESYTGNCYRLPADLSGKVVVDVGACIGTFAAACLERGAERVYSYEPDAENYELARRHLEPFGERAVVERAAVIGDMTDPETVRLSPRGRWNDVLFTGGRSTLGDAGEPVPAVRIGQVVARALELGRPLWLKLDCEGAEFQILASDMPFTTLERILVEVHQSVEPGALIGADFCTDIPWPQQPEAALGGMKATAAAVEERLRSVGFEVEVVPHERDPRLALVFADRQPVRTTVAILTPFRNARAHLPRYFRQIAAFREVLPDDLALRLVAAEGDSADGTREALGEYAARVRVELEVVATDHGGMPWKSVEDPVRMRAMSGVMNAALGAVRPSDELVVWIMADLEWEPSDLVRLLDEAKRGESIVAPMVFTAEGAFYDVWAYRKDGRRFDMEAPYHPGLGEAGLTAVDSAGSCLVMRADVARSCRAVEEEAVSFCADARRQGRGIMVDSRVRFVHEPDTGRRLLFVGDAIAPTGFARCTHAVLPALAEAGWELDVIGINYWGVPHTQPYRIWPAAVMKKYPFGELRLLQLVRENRFDAIVILQDPWNTPSYLEALRDPPDGVEVPPVVGWLAVDSRNQRGAELNGLAHVVVWTEFAAEELRAGGYEGSMDVVPLGVNPKLYYPRERAFARSIACQEDLPESAFIVGSVGKNQERKRHDLAIACFAEWAKEREVEDAYLYIHAGQFGGVGFDIPSLARYYGLPGRVIWTGNSAATEEQMACIYSACDVFLSTSQGEGWNLPALEAMACGVPCILPDSSGPGEWAREAAFMVPCYGSAVNAPLNDVAFTVGAVPSQRHVVEALDALYRDGELREEHARRGLEMAARYPWSRVARELCEALERVVAQSAAARTVQELRAV